MKSSFFNLLSRLYSNIICKKVVVFFQTLRWDTFKHAHPWKTIQYDTPKGVSHVLSPTNIPITSLKNEQPFKQRKFQDLARKQKDINKYVNFSDD